MKVALVAGYKNGAIDQVMRPLAKATGADVFCVYEDHDKTFRDYDLVHFGYFRYAAGYEGFLSQPTTANVWHIPNGRDAEYGVNIHNSCFDRIVVDDVKTLQQLGQEGIMNVTPIPIIFDYGKFSPLATPKGEFCVGIFCNNYESKRWEVIVEACHLANVPCHAVVTDQRRKEYNIDPIEDCYAHIHALAHASFVDTNSLPLREALLCGRPVITTHNDGIHQVVHEGKNGVYYDGSIGDLKRAILQMKDDYETYHQGALQTKLPPMEETIGKYVAMWEGVLDDLSDRSW